jgi:hypothetical protein
MFTSIRRYLVVFHRLSPSLSIAFPSYNFTALYTAKDPAGTVNAGNTAANWNRNFWSAALLVRSAEFVLNHTLNKVYVETDTSMLGYQRNPLAREMASDRVIGCTL